jgi:hypothetical protein
MRHRNPQIESEVFRAFRLTRSQVEKMPDGELLGALNRVIVEMVVRDQSVVITEQLQKQIDLLVVMPERQKVPRKKKRAWKFWDYGVPINYSWGEVDEGRREPSADKTPTVDTAIRTGQVIARSSRPTWWRGQPKGGGNEQGKAGAGIHRQSGRIQPQ